jgi:molybdopterin synthase sulfur carrier subunit
MKIKILYFMKLVELLGSSQEEADLPIEVVDVAGLLAWLGQRGENFRMALADGKNLQVTINKQFVETASAIREGDEIAFFPKSR